MKLRAIVACSLTVETPNNLSGMRIGQDRLMRLLSAPARSAAQCLTPFQTSAIVQTLQQN